MGEKRANRIFKKYKTYFIKILGCKALYSNELSKVARSLFKPWRGCNPQDRVKLTPGYQIINVDESHMKGSHWVAIFCTTTKVYVYDSFGRPTIKLLEILTNKAKRKKITIVDSDYDAEQRGDSEVCGVLCLAWLAVVKHHGIETALLI